MKPVEKAIEALNAYAGRARIIAGGTDLIPRLKDRELQVECAVDITDIENLKKIDVEGNMVRIGAAVTLHQAVAIAVKGKKFLSGTIVIAPVAPKPFRAREAEEIMKDAPLTEKTIAEVARRASEEACPRDSLLRGSKEYRKEMTGIMVRDALRKAVYNLKRN